MTALLLIAHIVVSLFLIFIVLLQSGKGAELGAAFGGSSQTLFGSRGAATFFSKITTIAAVVFMLTSLMLAIISSKGSSVIKNIPAKADMPVQTPAAQGGGFQPVQPQQQQTPAVPAQK
ncbi:MAG: preprotein translocase subunit SecG [Nitrospiraceae bacterium]|nr:preprotein translocase subunit SecG [Nitrospiraceae bacterium]